eukprot:10263543-Alexandrium_andersonii.AAC.1
MSASLVGSEMCIRDRPRGGALVPCHLPPGRAEVVVGLTGAPRALPLAVSYTHLTLPTICSV